MQFGSELADFPAEFDSELAHFSAELGSELIDVSLSCWAVVLGGHA